MKKRKKCEQHEYLFSYTYGSFFSDIDMVRLICYNCHKKKKMRLSDYEACMERQERLP